MLEHQSEKRKARGSAVRVALSLVAGTLALAVFLISLPTLALPGDIGDRFQVNDADPSSNIPSEEERNAYPLDFGYFLQDLVARAQVAFHGKDWATSVKYYEALAKTVPEQATAFSKLCFAYEMLGKPEPALENCRTAMTRNGALIQDHLNFLRLSLNRQPLDPSAVEEIEASLSHLREHAAAATQEEASPGTEAVLPVKLQVDLYDCKLAALIQDVPRLDRCLEALKAQKAEARVILGFEWARASASKDQAQLQEVLAQAKRLGLSDEAIETLRNAYAVSVNPSAEKDPSSTPNAASASLDEASRNGYWGAVLGLFILVTLVLVLAWRKKKVAKVTATAL